MNSKIKIKLKNVKPKIKLKTKIKLKLKTKNWAQFAKEYQNKYNLPNWKLASLPYKHYKQSNNLSQSLSITPAYQNFVEKYDKVNQINNLEVSLSEAKVAYDEYQLGNLDEVDALQDNSKYSDYVNLKSLGAEVKKGLSNHPNAPFELILNSALADVKYKYTFNHYEHFLNWLDLSAKNEDPGSASTESWKKLGGKDLFAYVQPTINVISGGCNRKTEEEYCVRSGLIYDFSVWSPNGKSGSNNCGFRCIEKLLKKSIHAYKERKEFNLKKGSLVDADTIMKVYNKYNDTIKPLCIIDCDQSNIDLYKYNYILYEDDHYKAVLDVKLNQKSYKEEKTKRGLLVWDLETRPTERYVIVGGRKSYLLKDTICCVWYQGLKEKETNSLCFKTNSKKSSVRQFLDWLIHVKKEYGWSFQCLAHNSGRFDHYFLISEMIDAELNNTHINLKGTSIINLKFMNHSFKDTCCFLNDNLANLCKSFQINHTKQTEIELYGKIISNTELCFYKPELKFEDFLDLENKESIYWDKYKNYCLLDCQSLYEIWLKFRSSMDNIIKQMSPYLLKSYTITTGLTISSLSKKLMSGLFQKCPKHKEFKQFMGKDSKKYDFLRSFIRGGISHVQMKGKHEKPVCSYDICSQYPASMLKMRIPIGHSKWVNVYDDNKCGWYHLKNLKFGATKRFKPCAEMVSGILNWNTGNQLTELKIDSEMIKYLQINYGLESFEVIIGLVSDQSIEGHELFGKYVNILFKEKAKQDILKSNDANKNSAYRECLKLLLNSLTGKLVEDTSKYVGLKYVDGSIEKKNQGFINEFLTAGLMIYSYSKRLLFEYIKCLPNDSDNVIQTETDSIYFHSIYQQDFIKNVVNYEGDYPVAMGDGLGNLKLDKEVNNTSYFLAKKLYWCGDCVEVCQCKSKCGKMKGVPSHTLTESGEKINLIKKVDYEKLYEEGYISKNFSSLNKNLFIGSTYISELDMCRNIELNLSDFRVYN